jgi:signal recognition particle subunit SRP54
MRQIGEAPGLLARLPGFRQIMQLQHMKGMDLQDMFGDIMGPAAAGPLPRAGGQGSHAAAVAKARLMGYAPPPKPVSDADRKKLKDKRKQERQNRKKGRRR